MRAKRFSIGLTATLAIFAVTLLVAGTRAVAQEEKVLHNFGSGKDGVSPYDKLIFDAAGNLYGTTDAGGAHGGGAVFELSPKAGGGWTEKILHSFGSGKDGYEPHASLILDKAGNLYGTTDYGGANVYGTVFEVSPKAGGGWTEKILHDFGSGKDGVNPLASLMLDKAGNLFGTTDGGGAYNYGTVFEVSPKAGGGWTEKVLHSFNNNGKDGQRPFGGLILDAAGNLYGTTSVGPYGTVFELSPKAGGGWTEKILHSFNYKDGAIPSADLIFDGAGNLYSTTSAGGAYGGGTVFELSPKAGGGWTEKVLHSFDDNGEDGYTPYASLIFDAGNLYGTTYYGGTIYPGCGDGCGTVFELTPKAGSWTEKVLHSFGSGKDGVGPEAGLISDKAGNLYGTTFYGGTNLHGGTVFEIKP
jgi:uncharacterized repeat protein (TIGR03803 family)